MNDEKKKLAIVGCLVAVMGSVGVFQLMGGKKAAPVVTETPKQVAVKKAPEVPVVALPKNPQVANDLPVRDPFQAPPGAGLAGPSGPGPRTFPAPYAGGRGVLGIPPMPTHMPGVPGLPIAGSTGSSLPPVQEHPFGYRLVGAFGGDRPAALFEDSAGNQKLVGLGSSVDGDYKLKAIERGAVVVEFRGKTLRLSMGGNPVGK